MPNAQNTVRLTDRPWFNKLLLLSVALMWGLSFTSMKGLVSELPVFYLLAVRNGIATVAMLLVVRENMLRHSDRQTIGLGIILGLTCFGAYAPQTIGLSMTTPGKNAFLTACYCVMVPFFSWWFGRERPALRHVLAAIVCVCGIGLVALDSGLPLNTGDLLSLLCGVSYALQIVALDKWGSGKDMMVATTWQMIVMTVLSTVTSLIVDPGYVPPVPTASDIANLLFLGLVCSCFCYGGFNHAMARVDPTAGAILSAMEAPFGVLASVLLYHEQVTVKLLVGFALIFVSVVASEVDLSSLKPLKRQET